MTRYPYPRRDAVVGIGVGIILSLVTCGIYALWWQYKQMQVLNAWLGSERFSFVTWILLSILTCGIFAVYYEYKMATAINDIQHEQGMRVQSDLPLLCVLLAVFGLGIASIAVQQSAINRFYGDDVDM
ncbi:MAG: DUF4234 domain-containing protein [Planctomycetes bacterium]|nr:DUF4234 domain-containing protein [Planctomycetota bacterium]